jgi:hypothetical protein
MDTLWRVFTFWTSRSINGVDPSKTAKRTDIPVLDLCKTLRWAAADVEGWLGLRGHCRLPDPSRGVQFGGMGAGSARTAYGTKNPNHCDCATTWVPFSAVRVALYHCPLEAEPWSTTNNKKH